MDYQFNWHKQLLIAVQSIADSLAKMADQEVTVTSSVVEACCPDAGSPDCCPPQESSSACCPDAGSPPVGSPPVGSVKNAPVNYDALAEANNRDLLLALCAKKGIAVPARTKNPTLAKMLKTHDDAESLTSPAPESKPAVEPDPFADETPPPPVKPVVVTKEQVLAALQKIQKDPAKGTPKVIELLRSHGGVETFKALPEDKCAAVLAAAEKEMGR